MLFPTNNFQQSKSFFTVGMINKIQTSPWRRFVCPPVFHLHSPEVWKNEWLSVIVGKPSFLPKIRKTLLIELLLKTVIYLNKTRHQRAQKQKFMTDYSYFHFSIIIRSNEWRRNQEFFLMKYPV